jgi:hypothetical protein
LSEANVSAAAIDKAPDTAATITLTVAEYQQVISQYGRLQGDYEAVTVELVQLRGSSEAARARLIQPYAWAVLAFLSVYGAIVAILLFLQGFHPAGFKINDTVMGVVVGSSAASAIGLVHTVVRGLFPLPRA